MRQLYRQALCHSVVGAKHPLPADLVKEGFLLGMLRPYRGLSDGYAIFIPTCNTPKAPRKHPEAHIALAYNLPLLT